LDGNDECRSSAFETLFKFSTPTSNAQSLIKGTVQFSLSEVSLECGARLVPISWMFPYLIMRLPQRSLAECINQTLLYMLPLTVTLACPV
jgi:hypothetical protein